MFDATGEVVSMPPRHEPPPVPKEEKILALGTMLMITAMYLFMSSCLNPADNPVGGDF